MGAKQGGVREATVKIVPPPTIRKGVGQLERMSPSQEKKSSAGVIEGGIWVKH